jgi:hypothetical protein
VFGLWNYFALLFTHAVMFFVVFEDLWLWFGTGRRARWVKTYDAGSGDTVLPCTRDSDGSKSLFSRSWCLERGLHFRRTVGKTHPFPGTKSRSAGKLCMVQECVCFSRWVLHSTGMSVSRWVLQAHKLDHSSRWVMPGPWKVFIQQVSSAGTQIHSVL